MKGSIMLRNLVLSLVIFLPLTGPLIAQDELIPGNKIAVVFQLQTSLDGEKYTYRYSMTNKPEAQQDVYRFWLLPPKTVILDNLRAAPRWNTGLDHVDSLLLVNFIARKHADIKPGTTLDGFSFSSIGIPGIISFYAEGEHPLPKFPRGMATDSIPGYDDLTPYGPGIIGKTVGPVPPPTPFVPLVFLDTLISYKHQAFALGWISEEGIVTSLDSKLDAARPAIINDRPSAKQILQAFVLELDGLITQSGQITSEAHALLKFNAEYLISKL